MLLYACIISYAIQLMTSTQYTVWKGYEVTIIPISEIYPFEN